MHPHPSPGQAGSPDGRLMNRGFVALTLTQFLGAVNDNLRDRIARVLDEHAVNEDR